MVTTEIIHDGLGNTLYRVSRVFPNAASASHAVEILGQVNPAAFAPLPPEPWELELARPLAENIDSCVGVEFIPGTASDQPELTPAEAMQELATESQRLGLYDTPPIVEAIQEKDEDWGAPGEPPREPPRCKSGACDL